MRRLLPGLLWFVRADWTPPELRHVPSLRTIGLRGDDGRSPSASLGVIVAEEWGANPLSSRDAGTFVEVIGNNRAFLASESRGASDITTWEEISFRKLKLLGHELSFTIDLSRVECGCNAAIYLVEMAEVSDNILTSGYCDIQGYDSDEMEACTELDLLVRVPGA